MKLLDPTQRGDLARLAMRLMLATIFLFHGSQKLFGIFGGYGIAGTAGWMESIGIPFPTASTVLVASTEFLGGLALLTGFAQGFLALPLAISMLVAAFTAHAVGFDNGAGGMEYPLSLAVFTAALGLLGPGRFRLAGNRERNSLSPPLARTAA